MADEAPGKRKRRTLLILTSLAMLALPAASRAADSSSDQALIAEIEDICSHYYAGEQCGNALHFMIETYGTSYLVQLRDEEAPEKFLERLGAAVKGGEAPKAGGLAAAGTGN